jgi:hypothetical protein
MMSEGEEDWVIPDDCERVWWNYQHQLDLLRLTPEEMEELAFDEVLPINHLNKNIIGTFTLTLRPVIYLNISFNTILT